MVFNISVIIIYPLVYMSFVNIQKKCFIPEQICYNHIYLVFQKAIGEYLGGNHLVNSQFLGNGNTVNYIFTSMVVWLNFHSNRRAGRTMGVGEDFKSFCDNLALTNREIISSRCKAITQRLNKDFYGNDSDTYNSFYGGSFGRGTAINSTSDVDLLFELPSSVYHQYNNHAGNGQSALLQVVKNSIKQTYSSTEIGADGQVVVVSFSDGIVFEVLPVFLNTSNSYLFPDSNGGGSWKITNPKPEIAAIQEMDNSCNGNLKRLCKMMRAWKNQWNVPIRGLLIDTLAYSFLSSWESRDKSYLFYDWMGRDFLYYLNQRDGLQNYWLAPGSNQYVYRSGNFEYKAGQSYKIAVEAIELAQDNKKWSSNQAWRKIYGTDFPE